MIDPDFDPYQELIVLKHNTQEIIKAVNDHSHNFKDLVIQHQQLAQILRDQQQQIQGLAAEIRRLKNSQ